MTYRYYLNKMVLLKYFKAIFISFFSEKQLTTKNQEMVVVQSNSTCLLSERQATHKLLSRVQPESSDLSPLGSQECRWNGPTEVVHGSVSPAAKPTVGSAVSLCIVLRVQSKQPPSYHCKSEERKCSGGKEEENCLNSSSFLMFKF